MQFVNKINRPGIIVYVCEHAGSIILLTIMVYHACTVINGGTHACHCWPSAHGLCDLTTWRHACGLQQYHSQTLVIFPVKCVRLRDNIIIGYMSEWPLWSNIINSGLQHRIWVATLVQHNKFWISAQNLSGHFGPT